jgi:hypothetical protein
MDCSPGGGATAAAAAAAAAVQACPTMLRSVRVSWACCSKSVPAPTCQHSLTAAGEADCGTHRRRYAVINPPRRQPQVLVSYTLRLPSTFTAGGAWRRSHFKSCRVSTASAAIAQRGRPLAGATPSALRKAMRSACRPSDAHCCRCQFCCWSGRDS